MQLELWLEVWILVAELQEPRHLHHRPAGLPRGHLHQHTRDHSKILTRSINKANGFIWRKEYTSVIFTIMYTVYNLIMVAVNSNVSREHFLYFDYLLFRALKTQYFAKNAGVYAYTGTTPRYSYSYVYCSIFHCPLFLFSDIPKRKIWISNTFCCIFARYSTGASTIFSASFTAAPHC